MGAAKRRRKEIAVLRTKSVKKQRRKCRLLAVRNDKTFHFKNEAARRTAAADGFTDPAAEGVSPKLLHPVIVKVRTHGDWPRPIGKPRKVMPVVLVPGRKLDADEFAVHVQALAQLVPNGFRQPSAKATSWQSTSLVEQAAIRAGLAHDRAFEPSKRGLKKREAAQQTKALIHLERLMRDNEARAILARGNDNKAKWFVGKVMAAMQGEIDHEWLSMTVPDKLTDFYAKRFKYMNAAQRRRVEAIMAGTDHVVAGRRLGFVEDEAQFKDAA